MFTLSGCIFAIKACIDTRKSLLNSNVSSTCPYNMVNVGPLTAEIGSGVWGTQQISTVSRLGFLITAPTLLNGDQPNFARCLAVSCAVYNIYTFWGLLLPNGIFSAVKLTLRPSLAFSYVASITARHSSSGRRSAKLCGVVQGMELRYFRRGRHLYLAGQPSRWT